MTGNGRGTMRAQGRTPPFILAGLLVALCVLGFSYWNVSSESSLQNVRISSLTSEVNKLSAHKLEAEKRSVAAKSQKDVLQKDLESLKQSIKDKQTQIEAAQNALKQKTEELSGVVTERDSNKLSADTCENDKTGVISELQALKGDVEGFKQQLSNGAANAQCDQKACQAPIRNILVSIEKTFGKDPVIAALQKDNNEEAVKLMSDTAAQPGQVGKKPDIAPGDLPLQPGKALTAENITGQHKSAINASSTNITDNSSTNVTDKTSTNVTDKTTGNITGKAVVVMSDSEKNGSAGNRASLGSTSNTTIVTANSTTKGVKPKSVSPSEGSNGQGQAAARGITLPEKKDLAMMEGAYKAGFAKDRKVKGGNDAVKNQVGNSFVATRVGLTGVSPSSQLVGRPHLQYYPDTIHTNHVRRDPVKYYEQLNTLGRRPPHNIFEMPSNSIPSHSSFAQEKFANDNHANGNLYHSNDNSLGPKVGVTFESNEVLHPGNNPGRDNEDVQGLGHRVQRGGDPEGVSMDVEHHVERRPGSEEAVQGLVPQGLHERDPEGGCIGAEHPVEGRPEANEIPALDEEANYDEDTFDSDNVPKGSKDTDLKFEKAKLDEIEVTLKKSEDAIDRINENMKNIDGDKSAVVNEKIVEAS